MEFELDKITNRVSEAMEKYDNKEIETNELASILLIEADKVSDYFNTHFDDLNEKEKMELLIFIYTINETIINIFTKFNNKLDENTNGFLSRRKNVLTFDFSWDKED